MIDAGRKTNVRRTALQAIAGALSMGLLAMLPQAAWSAEANRFDAQAFQAAQAAGKPVLVDIYASW